MEPTTIVSIIGALASAFAFGIASVIAYRATEFMRANNKQATKGALQSGAEDMQTSSLLASGKARRSHCLALLNDTIRQTTGAYVRAYRVERPSTMLASDAIVEDVYDRLGQLLATTKPPGTVLQFRLSSHPDPGYAIAAHEEARGTLDETYQPARELHDDAIAYYADLVGEGRFKHQQMSLWMKVPSHHASDNLNNGVGAFIRVLKRDFSLHGIKGLAAAITSARTASSDKVVRRLLADEREALDTAERTFRLVERESPLKLSRLNRNELFQAVYMGHNENALTCPQTPNEPLIDLRGYLSNESIEGDNWYIMHGATPVACVTMFTPPQPGAVAGMLRALSGNPGLTGRHTIICEYVDLDKEKSKHKLDRRIRRIRKSSVKASGGIKMTPEAQAAYHQLEHVRSELTAPMAALTRMRFYVLVYGSPVYSQSELKSSVRGLENDCENISAAMRALGGCDVAREEPAALRAIYHDSLVGELTNATTDREIEEMTDSLAALLPLESAWPGHAHPHTLAHTINGNLIGINLFQTEKIASPLGLVLGSMGSGKSVLMARMANDVLATLPHARVVGVDFGESLGPLVEVIGGRHIRFVIGDTRPINVFDYPGLKDGIPPDEEQLALVVGDLMKLARVREDGENGGIDESILKRAVKEVYMRVVAENQPGNEWVKREPTLSHVLTTLENFPWQRGTEERAGRLFQLLDNYRGNAWLDEPTHPDYQEASPFDVYELDSLDKFPKDVRESLAYRVAARVLRTVGERVNGELTPTLLIFDEMHKIRDKYPDILTALKKGARQGRKENVVTLLATHSYDDLTAIHDITANAGIKIVGKQIGGFESLVEDAKWSTTAALAIRSIRNIAGAHAQYVVSFGSGPDQQIEMLQVDLSPVELWTFTTHPNERNARFGIARIRPDWSMGEIVRWLANEYPRGLAFAGLTRVDERRVPRAPVVNMLADESPNTEVTAYILELERQLTDATSEVERLHHMIGTNTSSQEGSSELEPPNDADFAEAAAALDHELKETIN